jgi:mRNA interferase MazF
MAGFVSGDVVVLPFPFADNSGFKKRPALIVSVFSAKEMIVCAITSQTVRDEFCVSLLEADFMEGGIRSDSYIRPNYVFTVRSEIISYRAGTLVPQKMEEVYQTYLRLLAMKGER